MLARWSFWTIGLFFTAHPSKTTIRSLFLLERDFVPQLCGNNNQKTNSHEKTHFTFGICIYRSP